MPDEKRYPVRAYLFLIVIVAAIVGGCSVAVDACSEGDCERWERLCAQGSQASCEMYNRTFEC